MERDRKHEMEHEMEQAIRVGITSTVRQVYYRAGPAIAPGKSELDVSPVQCETLEADPRLVVTRLGQKASPSRRLMHRRRTGIWTQQWAA